MPQGTGGMGTGSDTRIYNPRSESSHMYVNNNEEDKHGAEDGKEKDAKMDRKRAKDRARRKIMSSLKHIKVRPSDLQQFKDDKEEGRDDADKRDQEREISAQTGPPGNLGFLTSLAMGAKGPGAAGGEMVAMGEPMKVAFRLLKAYEDEHLQSYLDGDIDELGMFGHSFDQNRFPFLHVNANHPFIHDNDDAVNELMGSEEGYEAFEPALRNYENELKALHDHMVLSGSPQGSPPQLANGIRALVNDYREQSGVHDMTQEDVMRVSMAMYMSTLKALKLKNAQPSFDPSMMGDMKSEPMDVAFRLLKQEAQGFVPDKNPEPKKDKGDKTKEKKDKKERTKKFRPSTGQFKMPPGGINPASATSRRAKARSRGIKSDKKTGLGRSHLSVEMSHRGVKTKQPMSKDPAKYRQYMGQQEGRKRLGNVRTVTSTPTRFGARSYTAGPTGGGRLQGVQRPRRPALKPHRIPPIMPPAVPPRPTMPTPPPIPSAPPMPTAGVGVQQMAAPPPMRPGRMPTSSVQGIMTGPQGKGSDLQKRSLTYYDITELRQLVNEARRAIKQKESKKKGMGTKDTAGAGSNLPKHPENGPKQTTRPEGATEDANNEPRTFGMDPIGHYTSRGGRTP